MRKKYYGQIFSDRTLKRRQEKGCYRCKLKLKQSKNPRPCKLCNKYANQDHIPRTDVPVYGNILEQIAFDNEDLLTQLRLPSGDHENRGKFPNLDEIFSIARLSPQQKVVVRCHFEEGLRPKKIAQQLRISPETVRSHFKNAMKKMRLCNRIPLLVRGEDPQLLIPVTDSEPIMQNPKKPSPHGLIKVYVPGPNGELKLDRVIDPATLPTRRLRKSGKKKRKSRDFTMKTCPRCEDRIFRCDDDFSYCMNCGWTPDIYED